MNVAPTLLLSGAGKAMLSSGAQAGDDALEVARSLCLLGEVTVLDLDCATRTTNESIIKALLEFAKFRLGGFKSVDEVFGWLDIGVTKAVLDSRVFTKEDMGQLPPKRVCAQLEVDWENKCAVQKEGPVVLKGEVEALSTLADELMLTFKGSPSIEDVAPLLEELKTYTTKRLLVYGVQESIKAMMECDRIGFTCVLSDSLATEEVSVGDVVVAFAKTDRPDGLYTTVVVDQLGVALGLVYSDDASIRAAAKRRKGIYHSRKRGLWEKGLSSGATQDLFEIALDCDRDALRFVVKQHGAGFCHLNRRTCWSEDAGVGHLLRTLESRVKSPQPKSYTNRLLNDPDLLHNKLLEESQELIEAKSPQEVAGECADVVYFASVICARAGVEWHEVETMLDRRSLRIRRRKGDAHLDRTPKVETKAKRQKTS